MSRFRCILPLCLALGAGAAIAADDLGRLFTTPAERARIDAARAGLAPPTDTVAPESAATAGRLIVNGSLVGSDGKRLAWVNGTRAAPDGRDQVVQNDGRVRLDWRDGTRALKPGQSLDLSSGKVFESYARPGAATAETGTAPAPAPPAESTE